MKEEVIKFEVVMQTDSGNMMCLPCDVMSNGDIYFIRDENHVHAWHCNQVNRKNSEVIAIRQFTGITDKNGKEIYFGDLLKYEDIAEEKGIYYQAEVVKTINNGAGVLIDGVISDLWEDKDIHEFEVIGNIYENKELIK